MVELDGASQSREEEFRLCRGPQALNAIGCQYSLCACKVRSCCKLFVSCDTYREKIKSDEARVTVFVMDAFGTPDLADCRAALDATFRGC